MTKYLISISPDTQWGADWNKRKCEINGSFHLYNGYDQLNDIIEINRKLVSPEFVDFVKSRIKDLIEKSHYKKNYTKKLELLSDKNYKSVIIDNVGEHGTFVCPKSIELSNCNEFAHVDEIADCEKIDELNQMNRLYICSKKLTKTTFINHNFPEDARTIDLSTYKGIK